MEEKNTKQMYETTIKEKYPSYNYAILFLDADNINQRKIGYSLLAPLFKLLPKELQDYVRYVWEIDSEKRKMPYSFVKCCERIFAE